jgi:hypothetical protein
MVIDTPGYKDRLFAEADRLADEQPAPGAELSERLAGLLALGRQIRAATEQPVTFRPALFWHDEEPVIWPRSVNLIQGQTGVHKSRVAELFGSAVLRARALPDEALGIEFRPAPDEVYKLLYVDTERNTSDQLPFAIQQLKGRAGFDQSDHPPALDYTSLVLLPRAERFPALAEYLAYQRAGFTGHLLVILDVLSDCVADYNDVAASLGLMDLLNVAVNEQDVTFLCVIHENPGGTSNKARGHLGTEAGNKASTALQVGFVKEGGKPTSLLQLLYLKRRYAAPGLVFFAVYDEAARGLVRAAPELAALAGAHTGPPRQDPTGKVLGLLPELLASKAVGAGVLEAELAARLGRTTRTVRDYLAKLLLPGAGHITDATGRVCQLTKRKEPAGLTVLYALEPVANSP